MKSRPGRDSRDVCPVIRSTLLSPLRGLCLPPRLPRMGKEREREREGKDPLLPSSSPAVEYVFRISKRIPASGRYFLRKSLHSSLPTIDGFHGNQSRGGGRAEKTVDALFFVAPFSAAPFSTLLLHPLSRVDV